MDLKIYILRGRKLIRGPYTLDTIKHKTLSYNDLVWYQGLPDWTRVEQVEEVKHLANREAGRTENKMFKKVKSILG
ncbi:MAG: DUF4339 domain-containing protein [Chitinophagaceae bacterium]|jgi:hypothetical protein|nr:DUF4339 domain-containing protein [Chitinophagaceae bacterium]